MKSKEADELCNNSIKITQKGLDFVGKLNEENPQRRILFGSSFHTSQQTSAQMPMGRRSFKANQQPNQTNQAGSRFRATHIPGKKVLSECEGFPGYAVSCHCDRNTTYNFDYLDKRSQYNWRDFSEKYKRATRQIFKDFSSRKSNVKLRIRERVNQIYARSQFIRAKAAKPIALRI